jgi:Bacterial Ig-like domain (group 3)
MIKAIRLIRKQVRIATLAALSVGGLAVALAPAAVAAGPIPSTTTISASPSSGTVGTSVTLTAKVAAAIVGGVIITPSGTVSFTYVNGSSSGSLGQATLGSCLLTACTAKLVTNALPPGTSTITGVYSGDALVASSSNTASVTMNPPLVLGSSSTVTCNAGAFCETGTVKSSNGSNTMDVLSTPSASKQTVTAKLETGKNLHCPQNEDNQTGALGTFSVSVNDTTKTVTYTGNGNVGRAMFNNYAMHTQFAGCFGSPTPFNGYVGGVYGPAQFVANDGNLYEAQLSNCANNGGTLPCFTNRQNADGSDSYVVSTPFGDPPKIIG